MRGRVRGVEWRGTSFRVLTVSISSAGAGFNAVFFNSGFLAGPGSFPEPAVPAGVDVPEPEAKDEGNKLVAVAPFCPSFSRSRSILSAFMLDLSSLLRASTLDFLMLRLSSAVAFVGSCATAAVAAFGGSGNESEVVNVA